MPVVHPTRGALGTEIRRLRKQRGWSQDALAAEVGSSQAVVSAWERGSFRPSPTHMKRIHDILGIPLDLWWDYEPPTVDTVRYRQLCLDLRLRTPRPPTPLANAPPSNGSVTQ